jgi:hypothetical protein
MNGPKTLTFILALLVGVAMVFAVSKLSGNGLDVTAKAQAGDNKQTTRELSFEPKATGSLESGDALVELTPKIDKNQLIVKFKINTHSVRLNSLDMKAITTLEYRDKALKPDKASRVGGHHASGKIIFNVEEDIDSFKIRIKGIPNIEDRVYEWR